MTRRSLPRLALAVALAAAAAVSFVAAPVRASGLLIADGGFGGVLEIKQHDVKVVVNNGIAVTEVEQVFVNKENRVVEALYTFPVPKGASVANFSMWINGREMIGEVVEKARARQIYESYKQTKRDPGLLEQVDYKRFEMRIFPIPAGAEQRVRVTYYQELDFDDDWATYVYPLATVTHQGVNSAVQGKFALTLDAKSEIPIVKLESPSHANDFVLVKHSPQYHQASLELQGGDLSRDLVIAFKTERPRTGLDVIASRQNGEDGYFQLTLTAGQELAELDRGMDYVFVLDISGSMARDGKLQLSRNCAAAFVKELSPEDRFEMITFNVASTPLFSRLTPANDEARTKATAFLDGQAARGGTILRPALTTAYRYQDTDRTLNVVVLSDGMTEPAEHQELLSLIKQRPSGVRVFCIGMGNEVNRPLLEQMAEDAGGLAAFISQEDNFERQAQAFRRKLMRPAMSNMRLSIAGSVYDVEPETLPNLYHGSPVRVYGRYRTAGDVAVTLRSDIQGQAFEQTVKVPLPETEAGNPEIERMWALHRVDRLLGDERRDGANRHKDEIVRLCEGYSIVSPYASFIVLENDNEYKRWSIERRNVTRVQRDRAAQQAVRSQLERLREQAVAQLGPADALDKKPAEVARTNATPNVTPTASAPAADTSSPRGPSFSVPSSGGGHGGGALDPVTAAIALGLAGSALAAARRGRRTRQGGR